VAPADRAAAPRIKLFPFCVSYDDLREAVEKLSSYVNALPSAPTAVPMREQA